jgi:hypothetical protein
VTRLRAGSRATLDADSMPQLVWLPDPHARGTARPVPPGELSSAIAPDVRLRGMTIEITRDRATSDLGKRLPWLSEFERASIGRVQSRKPGEFALSPDVLTRGVDP